MFMMNLYLSNNSVFVAFLFVWMLHSCSNSNEITVQDADADTVCEIITVHDDEEIGRLNSLAVMDSSCFVLSTDSQVYLYDISGCCVNKIGRSGNAKFEYNLPLLVRTDGELIYVWSAMTMKFIVYTIDGTPVDEFVYESALMDFCPSGDFIVIYPVGQRGDHIIDIYDKTCGRVISSLGDSSDAHKILCGCLSAAPFYCHDGVIHYLSLDRLEVMKYDIGRDVISYIAEIESNTFRPVHVKGDMGYAAAREYRNNNPSILLLINRDDVLYVLTSEGKYQDSLVGGRNDENRYCCLYRVENSGGRQVFRFTMSSFGYSNLLSVYDGDIYFISHQIWDDDDVYTLKRLGLSKYCKM